MKSFVLEVPRHLNLNLLDAALNNAALAVGCRVPPWGSMLQREYTLQECVVISVKVEGEADAIAEFECFVNGLIYDGQQYLC